jgi:hypothetical protein
MFRRHRPQRETAFSFDSFLDLVTNVVGIIIKLILVVWVTARSYTVVPELFHRSKPSETPPATAVTDLLQEELDRQRAELAEAQKELLEQLRQIDLTKENDQEIEKELAAVSAQKAALEKAEGDLQRTAAAQGKAGQQVALSVADIQQRREKINAEIKALQQLPPLRKVLRYRAPVSRDLHAEQLHFECARGHVTFVDMALMQDEIQRHLRDKSDQLKSQWEIEEVTPTIGAFRMHYVVERMRDVRDALVPTTTPTGHDHFGYGVSRAIIEPVALIRGETLEQAMAANSEFRHECDGLSPALGAVTFWVYPDSFALYRQLRDYLADRDITVAGRPLPEGVPMMVSTRGSLSRGQ